MSPNTTPSAPTTTARRTESPLPGPWSGGAAAAEGLGCRLPVTAGLRRAGAVLGAQALIKYVHRTSMRSGTAIRADLHAFLTRCDEENQSPGGAQQVRSR